MLLPKLKRRIKRALFDYERNSAMDAIVLGELFKSSNPPIENVEILIISNSNNKISDEPGVDTCIVTFKTNTNATQWVARATNETQNPANGVGIIVGSGGTLNAETNQVFNVDYNELTDGDRVYTITIYVNVGGVWYG